MGGQRLCAIGGYIDAGERSDMVAAREMKEQVALMGAVPVALPRPAANLNRTMYIVGAEQGLGCHYYSQSVPPEWLSNECDGSWIWAALPQAEYDLVWFCTWREAVVRTTYALVLAGIARLLANE
jgi:8-oxo-dGTP pyrophosphatase MutT (NUDIX family)